MHMYLQLFGLLLILNQSTCTDCPDGWTAFQGSCYLFPHGRNDTFTNSEDYCRQHHGAYLVHVESKMENLFIQGVIRYLPDKYYWMGLTDEITDGIWRWFGNDEIVMFSDWNKSTNEPNGHSSEDCAIFDKQFDGRWVDISCTFTANPICELRPDSAEIVG